MFTTTTKVIIGFAIGAIVGGAVIYVGLSDEVRTTAALSAELARSSSILSQSNQPPLPPCPPPPDPQTNCMTPEQLQMWQQAQQQQQQPPPVQNPDPNQTQQQPNTGSNQYQPPTGQPDQNGQYPPGTPQPTNGQNPNPNPNQGPPNGQQGQPGQFGPNGQPGQPFNAASTNIGKPPPLNFQQPAGLQDPDKCFREKGGEALVAAMRSGQMSPAQAASAGSCFMGNFNNSGGGQGQPGQGGPNGQPGQPFGQMSILSGDFMRTMSNVKPPANDCVAKIAGSDVADKMFGQGIAMDPETSKKVMAAGCFGPPPGGAGQPGPNGQQGAPGRQFAGPPLEVVDCLNKIAGNGDIQSGKRVPTAAEFSAGQACYAKAGATPFFVPPGQVSENSPLSLCAKAVIGVTDISKITPNSLTKDQKQRMRACYAPTGDQAMANTQPSLPQEAADCVKKIMGEEAFAQVSTGKLEPTAAQRKEVGAACFQRKAGLSKIAELSEAAVPLTQTQALMADVDSELVAEPTVEPPTTEEVAANPDESTFELTGELGVDVESVDIYYNSDATIVTAETKTDDSGKKSWTTNVAYSSLDQDEKHTLYALVTNSDGTTVRSPLVAFAAEAKDSESAGTAGTSSRNMMILYGGLGALVLTIIGFVIARRRHKAV